MYFFTKRNTFHSVFFFQKLVQMIQSNFYYVTLFVFPVSLVLLLRFYFQLFMLFSKFFLCFWLLLVLTLCCSVYSFLFLPVCFIQISYFFQLFFLLFSTVYIVHCLPTLSYIAKHAFVVPSTSLIFFLVVHSQISHAFTNC